jgi:hypothetical protein
MTSLSADKVTHTALSKSDAGGAGLPSSGCMKAYLGEAARNLNKIEIDQQDFNAEKHSLLKTYARM